MRRLALLVLSLFAMIPVTGCGGEDADLTVYSGRNEQLIGDLVKQFEEESGLDVEVRYGDSAELAAQIAEEGDNSPADVFFAQDAGALGSVEEQLAALPTGAGEKVDERFRDPKGRWVGTSARARVVAFDNRELEEGDLPDSILEFTKPEWKGRIGLPPTNASFQAFVSAMRLDIGDEQTRAWLQGIKANSPRIYENNIQTIEAIARGEVDVGFVNHYYLGELKVEQPDLPVTNKFLAPGDPGSLVNAAGVGVLKTTGRRENADRFVQYLLSEAGQRYFVEKTFEYPVEPGIDPPADVPPLEDVIGPDIKLADLGGQLKTTLELLDEVGLTSPS